LEKRGDIDKDKSISKRLAEELQRMKENSHVLLSGSEYVSIRILRDTPSLREYKLMVAFSRYSKPRLNGKVIVIKLTLPEEFPNMKPRIEISSGREDIDLNLGNYLENLPPMRDWNSNRHLFEVALSILEFFNNFAPPACPICLNKITAQEYESVIRCRNPRCLSLYHKNCFESWISRGYKRACVFCDTPI
jgi:ubiquitin-protein ligase